MTDRTPPRGIGLWLGAGLVISLAVNMFFLGLIMGGRLSSDRWADRLGERAGWLGEGPHRGGPDLDPRSLTRMLPESAQGEAQALFEANRVELRTLFGESLAARAAAYDAMRADSFEREALEEALAASIAADAAARSAVHDLTVELIADLTPEERARIGEDIEERFPRMHDRHRRGDRLHDRRRPPPGDDSP